MCHLTIKSASARLKYRHMINFMTMRANIISCFLLLLMACTTKDSPPTAAAAEESPAPAKSITKDNLVDAIQLVDLENKPIDLSGYQGKTIFLNFWATWCKPCIKEMPSIERARNELADENFIFLLASDESIDRISRFQNLQDFDLTFVKLKVPFPDLGIYSIPTTLVIDPQGKLTLNKVGAMEWDAPEVLEKLRSNNL